MDYDEILLDGPAGTSKSMSVAFFLDQVASHYPGCRILVARKTRVSLTQSWMVTFQKAMHMAHGSGRDYLFLGATNATRTSYNYNNGSVIVLGGLDVDTRQFSTEYDIVYVNEVNEITQADWESLNRACRNGVVGHNLLIADCNPDSEFHWMNLRCRGTAKKGEPENGRTKRFESHHEDNPWITGTPEGLRYLDRLRNQLTGVRRQRLYLGEWVSAEGAVYPQFSSQSHVIRGTLRCERDKNYRGREQDAPMRWYLDVTRGLAATPEQGVSVELTWFFGSQDWGWNPSPGHQSIWGVDAAGRMYLVWEWMRCEKTHQWWAERAVAANKKFGLWKMVCDNAEPEAIKVFNNMLTWKERGDDEPQAIPCEKTKLNGCANVDLVRDRLLPAADGHPRIFMLEDALQHEPDELLTERGVPYCMCQEFPGLIYEPVDEGKENKERIRKVNNHAMDDMAYAVRYAHGRDMGPLGPKTEWKSPLSWGALADIDVEDFMHPEGTQPMYKTRK
ncbi:MAG: phage terminase large subunit [Acidimicrobiia bacterium]